jgi:hypothetical protein
LACEWIGSRLAQWFGLSTLDFGIMRVEEEDEIPLEPGRTAAPGAAFVSLREPGYQWSGDTISANTLVNPEDIGKLVVFDTWLLNADRHPPEGEMRRENPDNVFLSTRDKIPEKYRILAIDHTHCLTGGAEPNRRLMSIGRIKDSRVYGLFAAFKPFLAASTVRPAVEKLAMISATVVEDILGELPPEWGIGKSAGAWVRELLLSRAQYLAEGIDEVFTPHCRMNDGELPF